MAADMGTYEIRLKNGEVYHVVADHQPTEAEVMARLGGGGPGAGGGAGGRGTLPLAGSPPSSSPGASPHNPADDRDWIDTAASWIPTVTGAAGGLLGGTTGAAAFGVGAVPGAAGGAAAGGALGSGIERAIEEYRHPSKQGFLSLDTLKNAGEEGAMQGGMELIGGQLVKGANKLGTGLYRKMLKPSISARLVPRAEEVVETGIKENLNPFSKAQVEGLEPKIAGLNDQVEHMVANTQGTVSPKTVTDRMGRVVDRFAPAGADPADRAAALSVPQQYLKDTEQTVQQRFSHPAQSLDVPPHPYSTLETRPVRQFRPQTAQDLLDSRRAAMASAGDQNVGITRGAETETRKELYHQLGTELGNLAPETQPLMNQERRLIDLKDAATATFNRGANQQPISLRHLAPLGIGVSSGMLGGVVPGMIAGGTAVALSHPRVITKAALLAARAQRQRVLANLPRLAYGGYHALTAGDSTDAGY